MQMCMSLTFFDILDLLSSSVLISDQGMTAIQQSHKKKCRSTFLLVYNRNVNGVEEEGGTFNQRATQSL